MNHQEIEQRSSVPVEVGIVGQRNPDRRVAGEAPTQESGIRVGIMTDHDAIGGAGKSLLVFLDLGTSGISEAEALQKLQESFPHLMLLVVDSGPSLSPDACQQVMRLFHDCPRRELPDYGLTPHQTRLLKLLVEGHSYKTAAAHLGVTLHTIDFHLRNVYGKLQVHSKSEAVSKALRNHLVP